MIATSRHQDGTIHRLHSGFNGDKWHTSAAWRAYSPSGSRLKVLTRRSRLSTSLSMLRATPGYCTSPHRKLVEISAHRYILQRGVGVDEAQQVVHVTLDAARHALLRAYTHNIHLMKIRKGIGVHQDQGRVRCSRDSSVDAQSPGHQVLHVRQV